MNNTEARARFKVSWAFIPVKAQTKSQLLRAEAIGLTCLELFFPF